MSLKDKAKAKAKSKLKNKFKKVALAVVKPFLPYIIIFFVLLFAFCTVIDAIFVDDVQQDESSMSQEEKDIRSSCISKASYLNMCHNILDGDSTTDLLDMDNRENDKEIQWSHLYALMAFHNMADGSKLDTNLLEKVSKSFESTFKYETYKIKTETTTTTKDENGNDVTSTNTSEQTVYLLIESDTIMGHYKYNYEEKTITEGNTKTTKKVFTGEELIGEQYERLKKYLKNNLHVRDDDLDIDIQVVIQASNGYYDGKENTAWLQGNSSSSTIITNGKGLVPKGMFTWPIPGYTTITSPFGMRVHPITGVYKLHTGTDVSAPIRSKFCGYGRWNSNYCNIFKFLWKYGYDRPSEMALLLYMHMALNYLLQLIKQ